MMAKACLHLKARGMKGSRAGTIEIERSTSLLLGGGNRYKFFDDVWAFAGREWKLLHEYGVPQRARAIASYGGFDGQNPVTELRRFDGRVWHALPSTNERPVADGGLVQDDRNQRLIAFGGWGGRDRTHADTWQFANNQWSRIDVPGPGERQAFSMVYDAHRGVAVVFGGFGKDPIARSNGGRIFVSSQDGASILELVNNRLTRVIDGVPSAGDIGYDTRRDRILVPLLNAGRVEIWELGN